MLPGLLCVYTQGDTMINDTDFITTKRVELEQMNLAVQSIVPCKFDIKLSIVADSMIMTLNSSILGKNLNVQDVKYPKNWIEAVKERWMPTWLKRTYPVKYVYITYKTDVVYPDIAIPNTRHYVIHEMATSSD